MDRLKNKVAIVTGSTSGIGEAIARLYAKEGAKVVLAARKAEIAEQIVSEINKEGGEAIFVNLEVSVPEQWKTLVEKVYDTYGELHILVNNAGSNAKCSMPDIDLNLWQQIMDINVTGPMIGMQTCAPLIKDSGGGAFVNISSLGGMLAGPGTAYNTSKWAMCGLSRSAAFTFSHWGIRSNCICPGFIDGTNMTKAILKEDTKVTGTTIGDFAMVGPGRHGTPVELAQAAVFLGSDESSYINGLEIPVDGGLYSSGIYATMLHSSVELFGKN